VEDYIAVEKISIEADNALQLMMILQKELFDVLGQVGEAMVTYSDEETVEQVAMEHLCLAYQAMLKMKNNLEKVVSKSGEESRRDLAATSISHFDCDCGCAEGCAWKRV
jgi:hypothetical protein